MQATAAVLLVLVGLCYALPIPDTVFNTTECELDEYNLVNHRFGVVPKVPPRRNAPPTGKVEPPRGENEPTKVFKCAYITFTKKPVNHPKLTSHLEVQQKDDLGHIFPNSLGARFGTTTIGQY
jgi:hypothetical protein